MKKSKQRFNSHVIPTLVTFSALSLGACGGGGGGGDNGGNPAPGTNNNAPVIEGSPPPSVSENNNYSFTPTASDQDGDTLTFSIENKPAWATFNTETGELSGTPTAADIGLYENIIISVSDGVAQTTLAAFSIEVIDTNQAPTISGIPAAAVLQDANYSFTPTASDGDGDALTFSIENKPAWADFDPATGTLSGTPTNADIGLYENIRISVTDGKDTTALEPFSIRVDNRNDAPVISGTPATSVNQDDTYSFTPTASDADGDALQFTASNLPAWLSLDSTTGTLTGQPSNDDVGVYDNITLSVTDGIETASLTPFSIEVVNVNDAPTIVSTPGLSAAEGALYTYQVIAEDVDGDTLSYAVDNASQARGVAIDPATGALSWTPAAADIGDVTITVTVTDDAASPLSAEQSFTVSVAGNNAPTIVSTAPSDQNAAQTDKAEQGTEFSYQVVAEDLDGDTLSYSIDTAASDAGMTIGTDGVLRWTPTDQQAGTFPVVVTVSDGRGGQDTQAFSLTAVVPHANWTVVDFDSAETAENSPPEAAFDGDITTYWQTEWFTTIDPLPHFLEINLGGEYDLTQGIYLPRQGIDDGRIGKYLFSVSQNGTDYEVVAASSFNSGDAEKVFNIAPRSAKYIRIEAFTSQAADNLTSIAELNVVGTRTTNYPPESIITAPVKKVATIEVGQAVTFRGRVSDVEDGDQSCNPGLKIPNTIWDFRNAFVDVNVDIIANNGGEPRDLAKCDLGGPVTFGKEDVITGTFKVLADSQGVPDATPDSRMIRVVAAGEAAKFIDQSGFTVVGVSSEETLATQDVATKAFDGDHTTFWHTEYFLNTPAHGDFAEGGHFITIALGGSYTVEGFRYLPRQNSDNGRIADYEFQVSADGVNFTPVASGTFDNNKSEFVVTFAPTVATHVRIVAKSEVKGRSFASIAELNVLGTPAP